MCVFEYIEEGLKRMFWGIRMATRTGWGLVRGVLGMNVMVIILFTRATGNISDEERGRFHPLISVSYRAGANSKTSMLCLCLFRFRGAVVR